jgi:cyclic pyranopterin phosphate synthase
VITHLDNKGNPNMVDVTEKQVSHRTALARSIVSLPDEVLQHLTNCDLQTKKPGT